MQTLANTAVRKGKVTFRVIANADDAFLFDLYKSTRAVEMSYAIMTEGDKDHFLEGQFRIQSEGYAMSFVGAVHRIIQLDEVDVGRLIVLRTDDMMRIIDLSLMPHARGRGLGTDVLRCLLNEAHGGDVPVRLAVEAQSPAIRLYQRHGFTAVEARGHHYEMEWRPELAPSPQASMVMSV
ncbi:GNAT family N-acetyltransferase [Pseudooctadecabacter sp.]|uniref:GNAT family N-acetyltransferase n=1 Tax=Pseudooctadecabacter sp. TaxID=1966338 RepID=UPI0035C84C2B